MEFLTYSYQSSFKFSLLQTTYEIISKILEIRDSQNLAKLGLGGRLI